ncbi:TonB-dependent receptor plug domain-containing protein [Tenacibaculum jejuense]|uniref:Probable TonB-dependent outer membrane receptor n=1 Tax=Tenacibaculum jejuense TaxID=584609 RepID=A0A238U9E6_9FLAO|nr:TonB-dependent receptor plug domain-containing protein [Tenacibaculum jejuense]SNR15722.1 Probable TonB-dependent outer membrane receptor precursor [Tenacibaculum jejuense]
MKILNKFFFVLFIFNVNIFISFAQNENVTPLAKILKSLEKKFNISFSYADKTIQDISLKTLKFPKTLEQTISYLEEKTNLEFKILNERFIIIKNKNSENILFENLDEISVQGYLTSGISKNNDGSISLKTNKLGVLPGLIEPDVLQAINALPGVVSVDESISNLNIRGGTHDQNLILFDGIRMYQSGHFFGLISAFNPHLKYNITLSKSGSSAKYGESISSIIDMKLPNQITNKFELGLGMNLLNLDILSTIPLKKNIELQIAARRSTTDFLNTPTFDQYFKRAFQNSDLQSISDNNSTIIKDENFKFHDFYGKLIWDIEDKHQLRFVLLNIENDLTYNETLTNPDRDEELMSELNQSNISSGITYIGNWSDRFKFTAQAFFTSYNLFSINANIVNQQSLTQENEIQDNGYKFDTELIISPNTTWSNGYHFSQIAISNLEKVDDPFFRRFIKQVLITHSIYSQLNYSSDNFYIKGGLRINYFEKFKRFSFEPRLALNYKFHENFKFEFTTDFKSQGTSQIIDLQNDFLGIEKRRWVLANESTPIITSQQYGIGVFFEKDNWLISTETYYKKVNNISSRSQGFQNQFQLINDIGDYEVKGIDLLIHKKFKNVKTWLSYSYTKNDYIFENLNNAKSFPNNVDIRNVVSLDGTYTYKNFDFALGFNWHSGRPFTTPNGVSSTGNSINYDPPNSSRLNSYLRLDASLNYNFKIGKSKATAGVSVWNILDKQNILNTYYDVDDGTISKIDNVSLGFTPNFSFRIQF